MSYFGIDPTTDPRSRAEPDESDIAAQQEQYVSRKGYLLKDLARNFLTALGEAGPVSVGKVIHYTADIVCSGGLQLWQKLCWDYAYDHIGIASPRIFLYLNKKFREINELNAQLSFEQFCRKTEIRQLLSEIALILQGCPKKSKPKYPQVPQHVHENEQWLRGVLRTTDLIAVKKVWTRANDMIQLLHAANEMVYAITECATERALFWVKWLIEEDNIIRKKYGAGLSTMERAPPGTPSKQKAAAGYYIINVLAEVYKEFAEKGMVRMHEEFQGLLDIYRSIDYRLTQKRKQDTIAIMVQILTDVPRWKVPAAPPLVSDTTILQRAVNQADDFFREVLALPLPEKPLPATVGSLTVKRVKDTNKKDKVEQQLALTDQIMMGFYGM